MGFREMDIVAQHNAVQNSHFYNTISDPVGCKITALNGAYEVSSYRHIICCAGQTFVHLLGSDDAQLSYSAKFGKSKILSKL